MRIIGLGPGDHSHGKVGALKRIVQDGEHRFSAVLTKEEADGVEGVFDITTDRRLGTIKRWQGDQVMICLQFRVDGTLARKELYQCMIFGERRTLGIVHRLRKFLGIVP